MLLLEKPNDTVVLLWFIITSVVLPLNRFYCRAADSRIENISRICTSITDIKGERVS